VTVLAVPEPYSFTLSTERFRTFGTDLATVSADGALYRVLDGRETRIAPAPAGVEVAPPAAGAARFLGLHFDLDAFRAFAADDPALGALERRLSGYRPVVMPDAWEALVGSITAQQVSLASATAIRNRLIQRFGTQHKHAWSFPARERLALAEPGELTALGFSRRKAEYVVDLARAPLDLAGLAALDDDDVKAQIGAIRGLGEWTADWFLARHLGRPRAWPAGDLAVRRAVSDFAAGGRELTIDETRRLGERFAPFENLAAHYLLLGARTPRLSSRP
jgi:DNA-3-methyladenine glycosylase II